MRARQWVTSSFQFIALTVSSMARSTLYVVTAIDAEGPIDDPRKPDILSDWDRVDALLTKMFSEEFRNSVKDSKGNGVVLSWFILTLTGFLTNPFNRPMGYHQVYDHYVDGFGNAIRDYGDGVYWHYHQPAKSGVGNEWCTDWVHTNEYDNILARLLIERGFFPSCFRGGGRIENNDTSWWLEDIIPFDFSCCSGDINWDNIESDGRALREVCDWSIAPADWSWFHPSPDDYQRMGEQKRFMFRCPDLASSVHTLSDDDIRKAFERTLAGDNTILAFFEHDRRDSVYDKLLEIYNRIRRIGNEYVDVEWHFANAQDAAIAVTGLTKGPVPSFNVLRRQDDRLLITSSCSIFGHVPFVAVSNQDGSTCRRIGLVTTGQYKWLTDPLPSEISRVAVAAASTSGEIGSSSLDLH